MRFIKQTDINEILCNFPDIKEFSLDEDTVLIDDLFLSALGFEQRCLNVPSILTNKGYRCGKALYIEYETNPGDNIDNRPSFIAYLEMMSESVESPLRLADYDFIANFNRYISALTVGKDRPTKVSVDISVFSSHCLLMVFSVLLTHNISLRVFYSEADTYHPTLDEFEQNREAGGVQEDEGISRGILRVLTLPTHTGDNKDNLPEHLIAFATFKPERTRKVMADVALSAKDITWIIGVPHLEENKWRAGALIEVNDLSREVQGAECLLQTFNYKDTMALMESLYKRLENTHHITISAMGSKLQNLGISLWASVRKDVTLNITIPASYDSKKFSRGVYKTWIIDFGHLKDVLQELQTLDQIKIAET